MFEPEDAGADVDGCEDALCCDGAESGEGSGGGAGGGAPAAASSPPDSPEHKK
jgi:hypothetical protein